MYIYIHVFQFPLPSNGTCTLTGVVGVGREKTLQFLKACKSHSPSRDVLDYFTQWRLGNVTEGTCTFISNTDVHANLLY